MTTFAGEFFFRTEDIVPEEILKYYVETAKDRSIVDSLKSRQPIILEGSRGVGKSFLLRVAEAELRSELEQSKALPVYVTFNKSSLIHTNEPDQFHYWMLARLCSRIVRNLVQQGLVTNRLHGLSVLAGGTVEPTLPNSTAVEEVVSAFENSWKQDQRSLRLDVIPTVDQFKDAVEDICHCLGIDRLNILIDEAAHIFLPQQQRDFFTLFRDLRSPCITCNAAIYPGITSFGPTFQKAHDSTVLTLDRDVLDEGYIGYMQEIVSKQANDSTVIRNIEQNKDSFEVLAYSASGNPRVLLKTFSRASDLSGHQVNGILRSYYRTEIWSEHSGLAERYPGHRSLVDWGRRFIETLVLPDLRNKNTQYLRNNQSSCFFWIHRDAPECVNEALRLLAYTGIVREHGQGMKASRGEIGTRYFVNLGTLFAEERPSIAVALEVARHLWPKRMIEFGHNHMAFQELAASMPDFSEIRPSDILGQQLERSVDVLDITDWQRTKLLSLELNTVGDVLRASESQLQQAYYVGEKRARRIRNAALAAVYEYLSG